MLATAAIGGILLVTYASYVCLVFMLEVADVCLPLPKASVCPKFPQPPR